MAYAMLVINLCGFQIKSNLLYFIPRSPKNFKQYVNHTILLSLAASAVGALALAVLHEVISERISFDFITPLILYVLFFVNLDYLESYWIALQQPSKVFIYSTVRTVARLSTVILAAIYAGSIYQLIYAIVIVELARLVVVLVITLRLDLLSLRIDRTKARDQLGFIIPLGIAASIHYANHYVGQIAISSHLGVIALAVYAVGAYQVPILNIIRGAIADAIFPDMVRAASSEAADRLSLWKRSNVAYTFLILPAFIVTFWYADILIPLVFTDKYTESVPIFRVLLIVMLTQCFGFSAPLRAANRNSTLVSANLLMLLTNLACILSVFYFAPSIAIFGPAIGLVVGYVVQQIFLGLFTAMEYRIHWTRLLKWRSLAFLAFASAGSWLVLLLGEQIPMSPLVRMLVFSILFGLTYFLVVRSAQMEEVETVWLAVSTRFRRA
jgi:O-antigen/teichoic acid export membrane protein